jgi:RND family efflux transporter MFP subunit
MLKNKIGAGNLITVITFLIASCGDKQAAQQKAPPPATAVVVYSVQEGNAVYYDEFPATITPLNQVDIRPQVAGYITGIFFKDGQHIVKGQKLYEIDQQQYQAAYQQSIANLNVAKANEGKAQQDADRYTDLAQKDAIAKQTLDHALADLQAAKMQVEAAKSNVNNVQTNLKYSIIYAPFTGTIGISQVKAGTSVSPGQTLLNTISTDDPMAVDFAVDQSQITRFTQLLQKKPNKKDSTFTLVLPGGFAYPYPGSLSFLDRSVDPQTGTLKVRLIFSNTKQFLRAGITCNVRVQNNAGEKSLLIPYKAVVEQLGEYFVFVVNDNKALQRKISVGTKVSDKIVVKSGLQAGEKVVIEGVQKLRDSAVVQVGAPKPNSK